MVVFPQSGFFRFSKNLRLNLPRRILVLPPKLLPVKATTNVSPGENPEVRKSRKTTSEDSGSIVADKKQITNKPKNPHSVPIAEK